MSFNQTIPFIGTTNIDLPYDVVMAHFIDAYFTTYRMQNIYVPEVILFIICKYIDITSLQPTIIKFNKGHFSGIVQRPMGRVQRMKKLIHSITPSAPILFNSFMKIYSNVTQKYEHIGTVLTANYLYIISPVNYQTWNQFKHRSKIDELTSANVPISNNISLQLITNLRLIDKQIKIKKLVAQLIGKTNMLITNDIILSEQEIPSLFALFGLPSTETSILLSNIYKAIYRLQIKGKEYKHCKYKVYEMIDFQNVIGISDLEIILKFSSSNNIKCKATTNVQKQLINTLNGVRKDSNYLTDESDHELSDCSNESDEYT